MSLLQRHLSLIDSKKQEGDLQMIDKIYEPFEDRIDALNKLFDIIPPIAKKNTLILAISDGGLFFASEIAKRTNLAFDFLFTQSIFAPKNPECEIAIVSESMDIVVNYELVQAFGISYDFVYGEAQRRYEEKILPDIYRLRKGGVIQTLHSKRVLIVDDGIDTGLTMSVAIKTCIKKGASNVIVATPVVSDDVADILEESADSVYSVYRVKHFVNTRHYYKNRQTIDSSIIAEILGKAFDKNKNTKIQEK